MNRFSGASFPIAGWLIGMLIYLDFRKDRFLYVYAGFVVESLSIQGDDSRLLNESRTWAKWFFVLAMVNIATSFSAGFFLSNGGNRIDRRLRLIALQSLLKQASRL